MLGLRCGARASHCRGSSCCGAWALGTQASVVVAHGLRSCGSRVLELKLSSCGARAQLLRGMWDLPGPGLEPMYLALAGRFLTTAPAGKPPYTFLKLIHMNHTCNLVCQTTFYFFLAFLFCILLNCYCLFQFMSFPMLNFF